jgi:CheY-like chemotaxis protein
MSGYEVAESFRGNPTIASTFLVALTGYGGADDQKRAKDAGFDLHLTKPIAIETLKSLPSRISTGR